MFIKYMYCHLYLACTEDEFICTSDGTCIPERWLCDQHPDCEDTSDEPHNCTETGRGKTTKYFLKNSCYNTPETW